MHTECHYQAVNEDTTAWMEMNGSRCGPRSLFVLRDALAAMPAQIFLPVSNDTHRLFMMRLDCWICTPERMLRLLLLSRLRGVDWSAESGTEKSEER